MGKTPLNLNRIEPSKYFWQSRRFNRLYVLPWKVYKNVDILESLEMLWRWEHRLICNICPSVVLETWFPHGSHMGLFDLTLSHE